VTQEVAMFGKKKRMSRAEQIAEDAWENLVSAMDSAGGTAKTKAKAVRSRASDLAGDFADEASARVSSAAEEAWDRATRAYDALAGHKQRRPWGWVVIGVLGGIAVGWAVAASAPKALSAAMDRFGEEPQDDFVTGPTYTQTPPTA
jgi:ElaB/YqjD/DUF883 family membrane-anchored ribosome-binding protein